MKICALNKTKTALVPSLFICALLCTVRSNYPGTLIYPTSVIKKGSNVMLKVLRHTDKMSEQKKDKS